jgi:SAM-dependent methyltransferase
LSFTERFTVRAGAYAVGRPSYPAEAIDALLEGLGDPAALAVADLGAGTGLSSRAIALRGPRVFAVEPNAAMRENAAHDERVRWIAGTAESTTLPDESVDVVAAFQAWHWVDHPAAVAEARRILRPHGRLAALYNDYDKSDPFTAGFAAIFREFSSAKNGGRRGHGLELFETIAPERTQRFAFANPFDAGRSGVHRHAESQSYLPRSGEDARAMHARLDELVDGRDGSGPLILQFITTVVRIDDLREG